MANSEGSGTSSQEIDASNMDKLTKMASSMEIGTGVLGGFKFKEPVRTRAATTSVIEKKTDMAEVLGSSSKFPKLPGDLLDFKSAEEIKQVFFGTRMFSFDEEWKRACFHWQSVKGPFPYGLYCPRDRARGVIMALEVHVVRHLLFEKGQEEKHYTQDDKDSLDVTSAYRLAPSEDERKQAFIHALVDTLWAAGEHQKAKVVLQDRKKPGLLHSEEKKLQFFAQSLHITEFSDKEQLRVFLRNHLDLFMYHEGGGVLMLIFSLILSRTLPKLREDLQGDYLFTDRNQCSLALIMLVLTGRATSNLFNGKKVYDRNGEALPKPMVGILERSHCGFLLVDRSKIKEEDKQEVGSMLKTPHVPVWLTFLNGRYSMLFCTNVRLTSDWRAEHRFLLHYYNGQPDQTEEAVLTIDTKTSAPQHGSDNFEDRQPPLLEECIHTRWPDACIDWNGALPFI